MAKPTCDHGPPNQWEPRPKRNITNHLGSYSLQWNCPTWLLHKHRQCESRGGPDFPHYCRVHSEPVVTQKNQCCRQCISARQKQRDQKQAQAQAQRQAKREAERQPEVWIEPEPKVPVPAALVDMLYSGQLLEPGEMDRILAEDAEQLDILRAELKTGHAEIAAGDDLEGTERIAGALADFSALLVVAILDDLAAQAV